MSLPFFEVCRLLSRYEDLEICGPPILPSEKPARLKQVTESWFKSHRTVIHDLTVRDSVALLSALLPERRTDLVFGIQPPRFCKILSRALGLGVNGTRDLLAYARPGAGDLAECLQRVLQAGGPPALPRVYMHEVDGLLHFIAGCSGFSGPSVTKVPPGSWQERDRLIGNVFKRLRPAEAKWLVRIILKNLGPIRVNETSVLRSFHFLLPRLLQFQNDLDTAVALLKGPLQEYPPNPDPRSEELFFQSVASALRPVVGVKVGRPNFFKARSIEHCMKMVGDQNWVLERKYDGEYCEIHIDLTRSPRMTECIRIFSKSGKDSTQDRKGLHQTLVDCLQLGKPCCKIRRRAILLGELVVYSDQEQSIMPFDNIRKHVSRSGRFLGIDEDSPPSGREHLAIVFFDLLVVDDEMVLRKSVEERRKRLRETYVKIPGHAMGAEWKIFDCSDKARGKKLLVHQFAASIVRRCEGLVLKECGVPYFPLATGPGTYKNYYIKLKKDYMAELGDEADFAVIGASYHAQHALRSGIDGLRWTEFHLGCLLNKKEVLRFHARPRFKAMGSIEHDSCIPSPVLHAANTLGFFSAKQFDPTEDPASFDIVGLTKLKMDVYFDRPFVFEVIGAGFAKPPGANFLMLRHARVKKLHEDRTWKDCISFEELQALAVAVQCVPDDPESQEIMAWIEKLERRGRKRLEEDKAAMPRPDTMASPKVTPAASSCSSFPPDAQCPLTPTDGMEGGIVLGQEDIAGARRSASVSAKRFCREVEETPEPVLKRLCSSHPKESGHARVRGKLNGELPSGESAALSDITKIALNSASPST